MSNDELARTFEALMPTLETRLIESEGTPESPWYRAKLDGRDAQIGEKKDKWVVSICLGALNSDPAVLPKLTAAIERANTKVPKGAMMAKFVERDGYLWAEAAAEAAWTAGHAGAPTDDPPESLRVLRVAVLVAHARELARTDAGGKLLGTFGAR